MRATVAATVLLLSAPTSLASSRSRPPEPVVEEVDVLAMNLGMAEFLVEHVSPSLAPLAKLHTLVDAVLGRRGLGVTYEDMGTKTAMETFETRSGNCLSFTFLLVAMARHVGLSAHFVEVGQVLSWDRLGEVILRNQHMLTEVELSNARVRVDFLPGSPKSYQMMRRITDDRALAHYYNNLGVETLADGDVDLAIAYFRKALETDESFGHARTNMGVAYRRKGALELAEQSHLEAMKIADSEISAATNLASLYLATGRRAEAEPLLRRIEHSLQRNPFHHYRQGVNSTLSGQPAQAIEHLREAIRRLPDEPEFHAALAAALVYNGEIKKAEASLRQAIELARDARQRARLEADLASLRADQ